MDTKYLGHRKYVLNAQRAKRERDEQSKSANSPTRRNGASRRPRGANKKAILKLFEDHPDLAIKAVDIAGKIEIPRSSVQAALKKIPEIRLCDDGLYRKRNPQKETEMF